MIWLSLLKNKWVQLGIAGLALTGVAIWQIDAYGDKRYSEGVKAERIVWQTVVEEARVAARDANRRVATLTEDVNRLSEINRQERREDLREVQEEIRNAATIEDQFAAYRAHRDRVLNDANANLDRARADYLSTVGSNGTGSTGGTGPKPPGE